MHENRTIIRVFLASPGDLGDERRAAREAVEEVNSSIAKPEGYQIDLYGWEDTISASGRPQAIINEELRQCELFIGMLWAKWGTPPDNDGHFTSGFEEEFELANETRQKSGVPEMRMYFKAIDDARAKDPGPELSRVLAFKDKLIAEKRILFDRFEDGTDFARKLRLGLADYIHQKRREREIDPLEKETQPNIVATKADPPETNSANSQPKAQVHFLESVAEELRGPTPYDSIPASHIARMRLIAMAHFRLGNDDPEMGPHDANLLYRERRKFDFEPFEMRALARFGLSAVNTQNKPLWLWLSSVLQSDTSWLVIETWSSKPAVRKGAFMAARLAGIDLLKHDLLTRAELVAYWLDQEDADAQKDGLSYLKLHGNNEDLQIILEKMTDASNQTSREFLEAALAITARYNIVAASELVVRTPFDEVDATLLDRVLENFSLLQASDLARAIEHRSGKVRARGLREMIKRETASAELGRRFADDSYLPIRQIALSIIERHEGQLSNEELKKILVKPKRQGIGSAFWLGSTGYDSDGNRAFEQEKFERLARQSAKHLQSMIDNSDIDSDIAYFAMVKRNIPSMIQQLRENFDDRFVNFFEADLERTRLVFGTSAKALELLDKIKAQETLTRRTNMSRALSLLVSLSVQQDLLRIRSAIDDDSMEVSSELVDYLARHGDWSDIHRLAAIANKYVEAPTGLLSLGQTYVDEAAAAIYTIARKRLTELFALDLKAELLTRILKHAKNLEFANLSDTQILKLLLSDNDDLRRVTALKVVAALGLRRAKNILEAHLGGERYFYNAVFWLDLLIAFPHARAKQISRNAL